MVGKFPFDPGRQGNGLYRALDIPSHHVLSDDRILHVRNRQSLAADPSNSTQPMEARRGNSSSRGRYLNPAADNPWSRASLLEVTGRGAKVSGLSGQSRGHGHGRGRDPSIACYPARHLVAGRASTLGSLQDPGNPSPVARMG